MVEIPGLSWKITDHKDFRENTLEDIMTKLVQECFPLEFCFPEEIEASFPPEWENALHFAKATLERLYLGKRPEHQSGFYDNALMYIIELIKLWRPTDPADQPAEDGQPSQDQAQE